MRRADLEGRALYIGWVSATLCRSVNRPKYSHSRIAVMMVFPLYQTKQMGLNKGTVWYTRRH